MHWTDTEKKFVADNSGILTDTQMAASLSRLSGKAITADAVRMIRRRLGVAKAQGTRIAELRREPPAFHFYTPLEDG